MVLKNALTAQAWPELWSVAAAFRMFSLALGLGRLTTLQAVPFHCSIPAAVLHTLYQEQERRIRVFGWRRTQKDPFEGEWEQIMSWLVANPERSSGDIFRELQHLSPGLYQPLQIRTLQRGIRKIRAHLLETREEQWQTEVIRGPSPPPVSAAARPTRIS